MSRQIRLSSPQLLMVLLLLLASSPSVLAADVSLAWDANSEPDLAGYKIYYGNASGTYGSLIIIGNVTTYTVTNLAPGTYYFVVAAYNSAGLESGYSNEVFATVSAAASRCDMNADGAVNVLDLQVLINAILMLPGAVGNDLNADTRIDVLDLQILVNVILGLRSCPI